MLVMKREGFPLVERTCSVQSLSTACFPGLSPRVRHAPLRHDRQLALRWTALQVKVQILCRYQAPKVSICGPPRRRRPLHSPRHPLQVLREGSTKILAVPPPSDRPEAPPEWVYTGVCTFPLLYHVLDLRTCHSTSCLGLLLTRDLFQVLPRTARCC